MQHVWCDTRSQESSQRFVLWAGYVLDSRCAPRPRHCVHVGYVVSSTDLP